MRRKGSACWSNECRSVVERKKCFLIWRRTKSGENLEEFRRIKKVAKRMMREMR